MVNQEIGAHLGMQTAGFLAGLASLGVASSHTVHVGTGATQVADVALEIGHAGNLFHFAEDALLAPAHDKLALMGADGAECAAAETASVEAYTVANHLIGGDALALVLRMRQARIGQVV